MHPLVSSCTYARVCPHTYNTSYEDVCLPTVVHAAGAQPEHTPTLSSQQEGDAGKRIRALQKKLRQVQQLREKAEQGATLESGQQQKLAGEGAIIAELQSLGISA